MASVRERARRDGTTSWIVLWPDPDFGRQTCRAGALEALGVWAAPVGAAITAAGMLAAAYAKHDPARGTNLLLDASGGVYTSPADPEAERFVRGEYASNIETSTAGPTTAGPATPPAEDTASADGHAAHDASPALAAESDAVVEDIYQQLRAQDASGRPAS